MTRSAVPVKTGLTFEEYLKLEQTSRVKHEFVHGQLFMMAGASERHNRIAGRFYARLLAAEGGTCRTFFADMKVRTPGGVGYYPDVLLTCDDDDDDEYVKRNPCLIVEVLSATPEAVDRGEKLHHYRTLESLKAYILVDQREKRVEIFSRDADGTWRYDDKGEGESLSVPCVDLELTIDELYVGL